MGRGLLALCASRAGHLAPAQIAQEGWVGVQCRARREGRHGDLLLLPSEVKKIVVEGRQEETQPRRRRRRRRAAGEMCK